MSGVAIEAIQSDITQLNVAVIVNAANNSLLGGGGVDGAIHRAAGPELLAACRLLNGCETGAAKITSGFNLRALQVIHTVGPVWQGGAKSEAELLANCYRASLALAIEYELGSIAFPCISTGVYGYPIEAAANIAVDTVRSVINTQQHWLNRVIFCCFSQSDLAIYQKLLSK